MNEEHIKLMIKVIDNLDVYVTDDHRVEMLDDMTDEGMPDYEERVDELRTLLVAIRTAATAGAVAATTGISS